MGGICVSAPACSSVSLSCALQPFLNLSPLTVFGWRHQGDPRLVSVQTRKEGLAFKSSFYENAVPGDTWNPPSQKQLLI